MGVFEDLVYKAVGQIPEGFVTTYGEIARALGDVVAARAVGEVLKKSDGSIPCHRVVMGDGSVGGYAFGGPGEKKKILEGEGVKFKRDKVDLEKCLIKSDEIRVFPIFERMKNAQRKLFNLINEEKVDPEVVAGVDVSYLGERAFAAVVVADEERIKEYSVVEGGVYFPYVPTYLAFREFSPCAKALKGHEYDLLFVDGHGTAHPRKAGEAVHFGVVLDVPAIGAAKSALHGKPFSFKGCFLSKGNYVRDGDVVDLAKKFWGKNQPFVLEKAHELATKYKNNAYK